MSRVRQFAASSGRCPQRRNFLSLFILGEAAVGLVRLSRRFRWRQFR